MKFAVIIPARYASTRFPGKPLAELGGKPMVVHVCERAAQSGAASVHVATDDERIARAVRAHGHRAILTRADHVSGTDRLAEAARKLEFGARQIVVNVQGDEPLISPRLIRRVGLLLAAKREASVSTACHAIHDAASAASPNVVKVVLDAHGYALYFSRSRIPFPRNNGAACYRHAGIYGYRVGFLRRFARLRPAPLEQADDPSLVWAHFRGGREGTIRMAAALVEALAPRVPTALAGALDSALAAIRDR